MTLGRRDFIKLVGGLLVPTPELELPSGRVYSFGRAPLLYAMVDGREVPVYEDGLRVVAARYVEIRDQDSNTDFWISGDISHLLITGSKFRSLSGDISGSVIISNCILESPIVLH